MSILEEKDQRSPCNNCDFHFYQAVNSASGRGHRHLERNHLKKTKGNLSNSI